MLTISTRPQTSIRLTSREADMAEERRRLDRQIKKLTAEKEQIDAYFLARLTENKAICGVYRGHEAVVLAPWSRITLDSKKLKVEQPATWAHYARENSGWRPAYS